MSTKKQIMAILILFILLAVMFIIREDEDSWICGKEGWVKHGNPRAQRPIEQCEKQVFCTAEAKLCPDGSGVGRIGPNCEFALCPEQITE